MTNTIFSISSLLMGAAIAVALTAVDDLIKAIAYLAWGIIGAYIWTHSGEEVDAHV